MHGRLFANHSPALSRALAAAALNSQLQQVHLARHAGNDQHIVGEEANSENSVLVHTQLAQQTPRVGAEERNSVVERARGEQLESRGGGAEQRAAGV